MLKINAKNAINFLTTKNVMDYLISLQIVWQICPQYIGLTLQGTRLFTAGGAALPFTPRDPSLRNCNIEGK